LTEFESLSRLCAVHGDSFYLLYPERFRSNLKALVGAFRALYPRTSLGYSYKTNYTPLFCRIADQEGCYAEVVSRMEYDLAIRLGVAPERVIFNGPLKSPSDLEHALLAGALVNVDCQEEVEAIEEIARRHPDAILRVGLRCNFSPAEGHTSRFGIDTEEGELVSSLARLRRIPSCDVRGLHCHFSSHRAIGDLRTRAERLLDIARKTFVGAPPAILDLGGGFFGNMPEALRAQFESEIPGYGDYAGAVAPVFASAFAEAEAPELVLEPGAGVVADAVEFVCRVTALKRLAGRRVAVTTGSIQNIKASPSRVRLPVRVVRDERAPPRRAFTGAIEITGYTCMERDVLDAGFEGELRLGDFLVFGNTGAYTSVFKPPFIRPAPAMLALDGEGRVEVARRREELDDLLATYAI
jgi:diaminopimelate decarboxylase